MPSFEVTPRKTEISSELLPYDMPYMTEAFRKQAKTELFEDEDTRVNSLKLFRSMLAEESNLIYSDDESFLLAFLRARKFDVKRAFTLAKTYHAAKNKYEELYCNFNYEDVRRTFAENTIGFLPYRDREGCVILVVQTARWNPHVNNLGDVMRALTVGLLYSIMSPPTQVAGIKVIFDFKGFTLSHLPHVSPTYLWLFAEALQNCFPARFKAVHMVNEGHLFNSIWSVLKQFLTKKLRDRFHFHGKNVTKLHKFFSPSILPEEYQGELPRFDNTEWAHKVSQKAEFFNHFYNTYGYIKGKKNKN